MLLPEYSGCPLPRTVTLSSCMRYGTSASSSWFPGWVVPRVETTPFVTPLRLAIGGVLGEAAQRTDQTAAEHGSGRGHLAARRLVHERHELVREARHRTRDADSADVRTSADAVHPSALRHVAAHDRSPAANLHEALG